MSRREAPSVLVNERIAVIKTGWSDDYQGGPISGDFEFITRNEEGHERFNFLPGPDGRFYGYLPPIGESSVPNPPAKDDWLIVFVAKRPKQPGLYIVGWYEDANFTGNYVSRPEYRAGVPFEHDIKGDEFIYAVTARRGVLVPEPLRVERLNTNRIKRTPIAYLAGARKSDPWRVDLARDVVDQLARLRREIDASGYTHKGRRSGGFAVDPEYRAEVEEKSMKAAETYLEKLGYKVDRVHLENRGFDLLARRKRVPNELHVEVKGTGSSVRQFFMTKNEYRYMREPQWRLAIVTDALGKPNVEMMDEKSVVRTFSFETLQWQASEKSA